MHQNYQFISHNKWNNEEGSNPLRRKIHIGLVWLNSVGWAGSMQGGREGGNGRGGGNAWGSPSLLLMRLKGRPQEERETLHSPSPSPSLSLPSTLHCNPSPSCQMQPDRSIYYTFPTTLSKGLNYWSYQPIRDSIYHTFSVLAQGRS